MSCGNSASSKWLASASVRLCILLQERELTGAQFSLSMFSRQILHLDLDAFYATVEMLLNPALRGKPLIVAMGDIHTRGVVATASDDARKSGVNIPQGLRDAKRLCPQS